MSLKHNQREILQQQWKPNSHLAPSIAMFYLVNPNASEEQMQVFAETNKIEKQMVSRYFDERKNQSKVNFNILLLKNGQKYAKPDQESINEYEKKLSQMNSNGFSDSDMMDIIPENIPKKAKRPEFQVINDRNAENANTSSSLNYSGNSSFSYSSTVNYNDAKNIVSLISSLRKASNLEQRFSLTSNFKNIDSNSSLNRFLQLNGNEILGNWIDDYKDEIESNSRNNLKVDAKVYEILTNILNFCEKLPITYQDLKNSKIGKRVNKLGKCVSDRTIRTKCEFLVNRWRTEIDKKKDDNNEKKYDKHDKYDKYDKSDRKRSDSPKGRDRDHSHLSKKTKRDKDSKESLKEEVADKTNKKPRYEERERERENTPVAVTSTYNPSSLMSNVNPQSTTQTQVNSSNQTQKRNINMSTTVYQQTKSINSLNSNQTVKKSILKKTVTINNSKKNERRARIRWEAESKMEKVKIFKMQDEPEAPAITDEEYQKIQLEILANPNYKYSTDMRSKEINMEKENMSKAREKSKMAKEILLRMVPQMSWRRTYELDLSQVHHHGHNEDNMQEDQGDYSASQIRGTESEEKPIIDSLCQKILRVIYFRDSEIPDFPQMGSSKLFSFTDESIPKLENITRAYNPEKPNPNAEILQIIDDNFDATPSTEFVKNLIEKLQKKEFSPEESSKISEYLNKHLTSGKMINETATPQIKPPLPTNNFPQNFNPLNMNMNYNFNSSANMSSMPLTNPINNNFSQGQSGMQGGVHGVNGVNGVNGVLPMNGGMNPMNNFIPDKKFFIHRMPNYNNEPRPLPSKFKTKPCRNYHGPVGCSRGDNCHFIHDPNFAGRDIPDFNVANYNKNAVPNMPDKTMSGDNKYLITNFNIVNNYGLQNEKLRNDEKEDETMSEDKEKEASSQMNMMNTAYPPKTNMPPQMNFPGQTGYPRPPFMMPSNMSMGGNTNGVRPMMNMNMNPQFMNQNPYMYMNYMRGHLPMQPNNPNSAQPQNQFPNQNKPSGQ